MAYINRQGDALLKLEKSLWVWASGHLMFLRALHVPSLHNTDADLMSWTNPLPDEWKLHTSVVEKIWTQFRRAGMHLFANCHKAHCPYLFSITLQVMILP